jgi:DNA processing protein
MSLREWIALSMVDGVGSITFKKLLDKGIKPEDIFSSSKAELKETGILRESSIDEIIRKDVLNKAERIIEDAEKNGTKIFTIESRLYPFLLKNIPDPPPVLYVMGDIKSNEKCVGVVGTRNPSEYGKVVAERIAFLLALNGVTVVSGMAYGIDAIAHISALNGGGRTIAVLGSGLKRIYPEEHKNLFKRICENGAAISEYPPDEEPHTSHFPQRNRIISGISSAVIVVEAGEKSGALITAKFALEQGREVFAVPGNITSVQSKGTNRLIKEGANPFISFEDLSEVLGQPIMGIGGSEKLSEEENYVLQFIKEDEIFYPESIIPLLREKGINIYEILTSLELKGLIKKSKGGFRKA